MLGGRGSGKVGGQDQGNTSNLDEREGGIRRLNRLSSRGLNPNPLKS